MFLLESLYRWAGTPEEHHAQTTVAHARALKGRVPGLIWKLWVTQVDDITAGGYYLFDTEEHARAFESKTLESLHSTGLHLEPRTRLFDVRKDVSAVTGAFGADYTGD
jgi:hypothetical protein